MLPKCDMFPVKSICTTLERKVTVLCAINYNFWYIPVKFLLTYRNRKPAVMTAYSGKVQQRQSSFESFSETVVD